MNKKVVIITMSLVFMNFIYVVLTVIFSYINNKQPFFIKAGNLLLSIYMLSANQKQL